MKVKENTASLSSLIVFYHFLTLFCVRFFSKIALSFVFFASFLLDFPETLFTLLSNKLRVFLSHSTYVTHPLFSYIMIFCASHFFVYVGFYKFLYHFPPTKLFSTTKLYFHASPSPFYSPILISPFLERFVNFY